MNTTYEIVCNLCGWTHTIEHHDADNPATWHTLNDTAHQHNRAIIDAHTATHQP